MPSMTRSFIALCLVSALFVPSAVAQLRESTDPTAAGFDPTRLARIDAVVESAIEAREIPGAVAMIVHNGSIVYFKSFGYADIDTRKRMQKNSIFRIASMTKAITTASIMILYERGHFLLGDPVSDYLPEFADPRIVVEVDDDGNIVKSRAATRDIRIIDLLTHASGIAYPFLPSVTNRAYVNADIIDGLTSKPLILKDNIRRIAEQPLLFEPGSDYKYGLSTDVLGYLVEIISGKSLDDFFRDEIFVPLGMDDTFFYLPDVEESRLVTLYADVSGDGISIATADTVDIIRDSPNYPVEGAKTYFSGGAGLSSTAFDYARFLQMLLNDGEFDGERILSRKSVELMRTSRVDMDGDGDADFGFGFKVIDDLGENTELGTPGSYSWGGAFYTYFWVDPQEQLIGIFMSQVRPSRSKIARQFNLLVYQALY